MLLQLFTTFNFFLKLLSLSFELSSIGFTSDLLIWRKISHFKFTTGGEVVNLEWAAEDPVQEAAGGLNMIGIIWRKRKS